MNEIAGIIVSAVLFAAVAYLLGSISFAVIFSKFFTHTDVRTKGSGNAGTTNVMRTAGKLPGILTFIFDFLKGTGAVILAKFFAVPFAEKISLYSDDGTLSIYFAAIAGIFCLLGHMFPLFFGFRGGKGVATVAGIVVIISPYAMLISLAVFALLTVATRIVSSSSIIAVILAVILTYVFYDAPANVVLGFSGGRFLLTFLVGIMAVMIILKHHENIKRLINGTENKIGSKKA